MKASLVLLVAGLALMVVFIVAVLWHFVAVALTGFVCWRAMRRKRQRAGL